MSTLAKILEKKIKRLDPSSPTYESDVAELREKINVFYADSQLTDEEYKYLVGLLPAE